MANTVRPIPRRILAMFLTDHEAIKIFEELQQNAGVALPNELLEIQFAAESADTKAGQALGALERIAHALEMLASAPQPLQSPHEVFVPGAPEQLAAEDFGLPCVGPEAPVYGGMYMNAPQVVAVAAALTPYKLTAGASAGFANLVTFGGAHYLQADRGGVFLVEWSMSVASAAGAGDHLEGGIMIDGAAQAPGRADANMGAAGARAEISGQAFLRLSPLQQISLFVQNDTAANNIEIEHMSCTITLIDWRTVS